MSSISVEHSSDHSLIVFTWKEKGKIIRQVRDHSKNSTLYFSKCGMWPHQPLNTLLFAFSWLLNLTLMKCILAAIRMHCRFGSHFAERFIVSKQKSFVLTTKATCRWTVFQQVVLPFLHCTVPFVLASFAQLLRLNIVTVIYKRKAN